MERIQRELHEWRQNNFPGTSTAGDQFMGMVEEMGELAHAMLKQRQRIRGSFEEHEAAQKDAIADLTIFMMGFCSAKGWNFQRVVEDTANDIMRRDWAVNPLTGEGAE
jgi:NTP pyrophosphatase (non-canonical NTP hydrolase)